MAAALYKNYVSVPGNDLWKSLLGGTKSFTRSDFTGSLLNSAICVIPAAAAGIPAALTNQLIHACIPSHLPFRRVFSILATGSSVVVGVGVNFFVVNFLAANRITVENFSSDKALKLQVVGTLPALTLSPIFLTLGMYDFCGYAGLPIFFGIGATAGYFGHRSLQVIGALSALYGASKVAIAAEMKKDDVPARYVRLDAPEEP